MSRYRKYRRRRYKKNPSFKEILSVFLFILILGFIGWIASFVQDLFGLNDWISFVIGTVIFVLFIFSLGVIKDELKNKRKKYWKNIKIEEDWSSNNWEHTRAEDRWKDMWSEVSIITQESSQRIFRTLKWEKVKSYWEKAIADFLYKQNVKYIYEKPFRRHNWWINKPDFYLVDYDLYIEYFGMYHYSKKYWYEIWLKRETFKEEWIKVMELWKNNIWKNLWNIIRARFTNILGIPFPQKNYHQ